MYEVISVVTTTKLHDNFDSFEQEWIKDHPDYLNVLLSKLTDAGDSISRRDREWNTETNTCEITILFKDLESALDYMRDTYMRMYQLDVSKMTYNDIQFKEYLLNTTVSIFDGKYTIKVISLKEVN